MTSPEGEPDHGCGETDSESQPQRNGHCSIAEGRPRPHAPQRLEHVGHAEQHRNRNHHSQQQVGCGAIQAPMVESPSGNFLFDQAALRAVTQANPLPPLPDQFEDEYLGVHFSFAYEEE